SDTAGQAVGQAVEIAKAFGARLSIVSAYSPASSRRVQGEQSEAPADVQYEVGPREDVILILDAAAAEAKAAGIEVQTHPVEGGVAELFADRVHPLGRR